MGLVGAASEKPSFIFNLIVILIFTIHFLGCFWIYLGKTVEDSWLYELYCTDEDFAKGNCQRDYTITTVDDKGADVVKKLQRKSESDGRITLNAEDDSLVYITSLYWVITTLTTVGYGDFKGYTPTEYGFQMIVEFLGIGFFSFLMNSINSLFGSEKSLSDIIDKRIENVEAWLRMVEKSRSKNFTKQMYDSIKVYTEQSYKFDYNIINQEEFFSQLKPRIRHRLVQILFNPFVFNFSYMFKDDGFESGSEFKNDFLTNIYSRLYLPRNDIIRIGENFRELMMI